METFSASPREGKERERERERERESGASWPKVKCPVLLQPLT